MQNSEDGQSSREEKADEEMEVSTMTGQEDEEYNMRHPRRGYAYIFNHQNFEHHPPRDGTQKDVIALSKTFSILGFKVKIYDDLTYTQLMTTMMIISKADYQDCDCLVVVVMSYGEQGYIHCYDASYPQHRLWNYFAADKCPSLASKPKLFFIQAGRGSDLDHGVKLTLTGEGPAIDTAIARYILPTCADFLIAHATVEGYSAWRDPVHGSWFMQVLCEELNKYGRTLDLFTILTSVCRRVSTDFQSKVPHDERLHLKKQVPAFTSMLTRQMFFRGDPDPDPAPALSPSLVT